MAVYFIQDETLCFVKIGSAADPAHRLIDLQVGSPSKLVLLATIDGGVTEEKELHKKFAEYRDHGEWFRPGPKLMAYLLDLAQSQPETVAGPPAIQRIRTATPRTMDELGSLAECVGDPGVRRLLVAGLARLSVMLDDVVHRANFDADLHNTTLAAEYDRLRKYLGDDE